MHTAPARLHRALVARDARFDGVFFVGVTSTGVYCRPICPSRTPRASNCRFFSSAAEAEHAGFRPCLRCRPELAPGLAPLDDATRIARAIVQRLGEHPSDEPAGLEAIADQFELSSRQIRRIVQSTLGVPPMQLVLTKRLLLAKQLLTETSRPMADVAFASGFSSVRRFNDAFTKRYRMPPTALRRQGTHGARVSSGETSVLQLTYRPPFDWPAHLTFLAARALPEVEHVTRDVYARTVRLGTASGWIRITRTGGASALSMEFTSNLLPVLPMLVARVRALFDLDARPDLIAGHLAGDPKLAPSVRANPGLRVPGAFDGFEVGVRAILGQQISVKSATTLAARLVHAFGEPMSTPVAELRRLTPTADRVAAVTAGEVARHGIVRARAASLIALASAEASGKLGLDLGSQRDPDLVTTRLASLPGIGPWTAQYICMRALAWPDAFPKEDLVIRRALGGVTPTVAEARSQGWRPWRSYAVMHLWRRNLP